MIKHKLIAASIITASLVGTMTLTAIAGKANLADVQSNNETISTFSKSVRNLLSDEEAVTESKQSYDLKISRFGIGMDVDLICEILGVTKEELSQQLKDNDGNIYKILEDSGKADEYKTVTLAKYKEKIDKAVADGKITQEKADEMYAAMKESVDNLDSSAENNFRIHIGEKFDLGDMPSLDIEGLPEEFKNKIEAFKNKFGDPEERIEHSIFMVDIDAICEFLGITKEEFSQILEDNDGNIYKILEDSGKLEEYKASALAKYKESLDEKVAGGKLTQEKADEMYTSMKESLENFDGNIRIHFKMDADGLIDKFKEHFKHGDGEDFTFDLPDIIENFKQGGKDNSSAASGVTVQDL